jgi:hypothetical protein
MSRPDIVEYIDKDDKGRDIVLLDDGRQARLYPSGSLQEVGTGYWIAPSPEQIITRETAREYHARAREARIRATQDAIIDGTGQVDLRSGMKVLGAALVGLVQRADSMASVRAYEALMKASGSETDTESDNALEIKVSREGMKALADILTRTGGGIIDV